MARVKTSTKGVRGAPIKCGRCSREIKPGETYFWSQPGFRSSYKNRQIRCIEHPFRASELTSSKIGQVLAAIEGADLASQSSADDLKSALESVAEVAEDIASEYEEAAQNFGGAGENQDRADALSDYASNLRDWEADPDVAPGCEEHEENQDEGCDDCEVARQDWWEEVVEQAQAALDEVPS